MKDIQAILARAAELYAWVDQQIQGLECSPCQAAGQCCDFSGYDHRLFVTTPELIHFQLQLTEPVRSMTTGGCPYQEQRKQLRRTDRHPSSYKTTPGGQRPVHTRQLSL